MLVPQHSRLHYIWPVYKTSSFHCQRSFYKSWDLNKLEKGLSRYIFSLYNYIEYRFCHFKVKSFLSSWEKRCDENCILWKGKTLHELWDLLSFTNNVIIREIPVNVHYLSLMAFSVLYVMVEFAKYVNIIYKDCPSVSVVFTLIIKVVLKIEFFYLGW